MTVLHTAAKAGDLQHISRLLYKGADIEAKDEWDFTPLLVAITNHQLAATKLLISSGADVNTKAYTSPALYYAISHYNCKAVDRFTVPDSTAIILELINAGADIWERNEYGECAIDWAMSHLSADHLFISGTALMESLLEEGALNTHPVSAHSPLLNPEPGTKITLATYRCVERYVNQYLQHFNSELNLDEDELFQDDLAINEFPDGVAVNKHDRATRFHAITDFSKLVRAAAASNSLQASWMIDSLAHAASWLPNDEGKNIFQTPAQDGRTALHFAAGCKKARPKMINKILAQGGDPLSVDVLGRTPGHCSARWGMLNRTTLMPFVSAECLAKGVESSSEGLSACLEMTIGVQDILTSITGNWKGTFTYTNPAWGGLSGSSSDLAIFIRQDEYNNSDLVLFSSEGRDESGLFKIHGQLMPGGLVAFLKLYREYGWLYHGSLSADRKVISGTWGAAPKLWHGTFTLKMEVLVEDVMQELQINDWTST